MKIQPKPIVALASGAFLLLGLVCQTAQAQLVIDPATTVALADLNGNGTAVGIDALPVTYEVTETITGPNSPFYTYSYTVNNTTPSAATDFNVDSGGITLPGAVLPGTISANGFLLGASGVTWFTTVQPGASQTFSFESDLAPLIVGSANSSGDNSVGGWASLPNGSLVAAPPAIPEPATMALFGLGSLLLGARKNLFRKS